jgi:putative endonuclease
MPAFNYILQCADGTLYTGWTTDLLRRLKAHAAGTGAKYTRARLPVRLVFVEKKSSRQEAMRREFEIKQLPRSGKLRLIAAGSHDLSAWQMQIGKEKDDHGRTS